MPYLLSDNTAQKLNQLINSTDSIRTNGYRKTTPEKFDYNDTFHVRTLDPKDPDYDTHVEIHFPSQFLSVNSSGNSTSQNPLVYDASVFDMQMKDGEETIDIDAELTPTEYSSFWYKCKLANNEYLYMIANDMGRVYDGVTEKFDYWALAHIPFIVFEFERNDTTKEFVTHSRILVRRIPSTNANGWSPDKILTFWEGNIYDGAPVLPYKASYFEDETIDINPSTNYENGKKWQPQGIDSEDSYSIPAATPASFNLLNSISFDTDTHQLSFGSRKCILSYDGRINYISEISSSQSFETVAEGVYP